MLLQHQLIRSDHGIEQRGQGSLEHLAGPDDRYHIEKRTEDFTFDGQKFKPTADDPYWIVESEKSGKHAAHKESTLKKA